MNAVTGNNEHPRYYFTADEVLLEISYKEGRAMKEKNRKNAILSNVREFLSKDGTAPPAARNWKKALELPDSSRIATFSSRRTQLRGSDSFALVPLKLKVNEHDPQDFSPDDVLRLLNDAYTELGDSLTSLEGEQGRKPPGLHLRENSPYFLKAITPNWLSSGLHHGKGTNGPGSIPARRNAPTANQHKFVLKGHNPFDSFSAFRMPGAEVAILDTAQPLENILPYLTDEHKKYFANVQVILHPDFEPKGDPPKSIYEEYAHLPNHYKMPDHGTYIAGLISFLTPTTQIFLYQAFNEYGVGSFKTISDALIAAVNRRGEKDTDLVIDCSFMLEHDMPTDKDMKNLSIKELKKLLETHTKETLMKPMQDVFEWATNCRNVVVVAAAGNDGDPDPTDNKDERSQPRYPAAFDKVLSVTSLPKGHPRTPDDPVDITKGREYIPATYSNRAYLDGSSEDKVRRSFAIFGGGLFEKTIAPLGGALGVYVGVIPRQQPDGTFVQEGNPNETGWVQWSGTSFAAPIVAALLAAPEGEVAADNSNMPYSGDPKEKRYYTTAKENVIAIAQGG